MSKPSIQADLTVGQVSYYLSQLDETGIPYHWVVEEIDFEDEPGSSCMTSRLVVDGTPVRIIMIVTNTAQVQFMGSFAVSPTD